MLMFGEVKVHLSSKTSNYELYDQVAFLFYQFSFVFFINLPAAPCKQEPPFFMQKNWESIRYKVDDDDDIDYDEHEDKYSGMSWELLKKVKEVMEEEMGVEFNYE